MFDTRTRLFSFACLKDAAEAGAGSALKNAAPDQKKIGSGAALKVAAPGGSGSATLCQKNTGRICFFWQSPLSASPSK